MNAQHAPRTLLQVTIAAGLLAGVLDLVAALSYHGMSGIPPQRILQGIAGGLLGNNAYGGGWKTAMLGLFLHFAIMFVIAAVYAVVARRVVFLAVHQWLSGIAFGVIVYFVMNGIVLPLSAFPHEVSFAPARMVPALVIQVLFVGIPIALMYRYLSKTPGRD